MDDAGHYEVQCGDYNSEGSLKVLECKCLFKQLLNSNITKILFYM